MFLSLAVGLFAAAIVAGIYGFGESPGSTAWVGQVGFVLFLMLFLISLLVPGRKSR
jgi:uncharacterized membrane protein YtjA (UPF0391 family)